ERNEADEPGAEADNHGRRRPPLRRGFDDSVEEGGETDGDQHGPGGIETAGIGVPTRWHQVVPGDDGDDDDGDVDQEDRAPEEVLEQEPAGERTSDDADAGHARPDPDS